MVPAGNKAKRFRRLTIPQKQFIIITEIVIVPERHFNTLLSQTRSTVLRQAFDYLKCVGGVS